MSGETDEITIELSDDGGTIVVDAGTGTVVQPAALSDDPQAGIEEMRRQVETANRSAEAANVRAGNESRARADAERRASVAAEETKRANTVAGNSQYDSVVSALSASEREIESIQSQKSAALEKGDYAEDARLAVLMSKLAARIVSLETGKSEIERVRSLPPVQQAPVAQQAPTNETFLASLPARSADWIRAHPQFFSDQSFHDKVLAAAQFAENVKGLNHNSDDYFKFIEEESGVVTRAAPAAQPTSAAAVVVTRDSPAPQTQPAQRPAAPVAAAPSRSVPDMNGRPANPRSVTLSKEEREIARIMHPKLKPSDPDPEVVYARNKYALQQEGRIGTGH